MNIISLKNKVLYTVILVCLVFGVLQFTQCEGSKPSVDWKTFNGKSFMIDYPANWDLDTTGYYNVQVFTCLSPESGNIEETLSVGIVMITDTADLEIAIDNYISQLKMNTSKGKSVELGNQKSVYIESNNNKVFFKNYFVKKDNILYYIFFAGEAKAIKLWDYHVKKMVSSFRVIEVD